MAQRTNGKVITKSELIERLSERQSHLLTKDVDSAVKHVLEYLSKSLSAGKRVEIRGFGSFSLRRRKARMARNPRTGASVLMAGKSLPYFRPGKPLRDRVRNPASSLSRQEPPSPQQASPQQESSPSPSAPPSSRREPLAE